MCDDLIEKLRAICNEYSDILGLVVLFGSYSRGEAEKGSDIDLYIEPKDKTMTTSRFGKSRQYKNFKFALYDGIGKEFDLLAYGGIRDIANIRKSPLWEQIKKDGVVIYGQEAERI